MNKQQWLLLAVSLLLIGGSAAFLGRLRSHQVLSPPGVKTHALTDSRRLAVDLPESVLDYSSVEIPIESIAIETLPQDTSFGQRGYTATNGGFQVALSVVLMGSDRTSLHKPQFCLEGAGWHIEDAASSERTIHVEQPCAYDLPVTELVASSQLTAGGQTFLARKVYVYWFVSDKRITARHGQRMWWMAEDLLRTGVLDRWAYVSCAAICPPGQEEATYARLAAFIAAAVPDFQLTPKASSTDVATRP